MNEKYHRYKNTIIILGLVFIGFFIYNFISLFAGTSVTETIFIPDTKTIPVILLKSVIDTMIITGTTHAILFIYYFVKNKKGATGLAVGLLLFMCFPIPIAAGIVTLLPYYIYSAIRFFSLSKSIKNFEPFYSNDGAALFFRNFKNQRGNEIKPYVSSYVKNLWIFRGIFAAVVIVILLVSALFNISTGFILILPVSYIALLYIWEIRKVFIYSRINKLYTDKCDPEIVAAVYNEIEKIDHSKTVSRQCLLMKCSSFVAMGMNPEAKSRLFAFDIRSVRSVSIKIGFYAIMFRCCRELNDMYNIIEIRKQTEILYQAAKKPRYNEIIKQNLMLIDAYIFYTQRNYEMSRKLYTELLAGSKTKSQSVMFNYLLALIDLIEDKKEIAREKFEFVVNFGNKLAVVTYAKDNLSRI